MLTAEGILTQEELRRQLQPVIPEESRPWNDAELQTVKSTLWERYLDRNVTTVNDKMISETYAAALNTAPDSTKLGWGYAAADMDPSHVMKSASMPWAIEKMQQYDNAGQKLLGGEYVAKDVLGVSGTSQTGSVLVNQRVIPQLSVWFYQDFTAMSRIPRVPATGLDFEWNNVIALGDENDGFLDDDGCPISAKSVYFRGRSNIALLGIKRGTNLRLDLAIRAGGVLYNGGMSSYELEMRSALTVRARLAEKTMFQGTTLDGHPDPADSEYGKTFLRGYNGFRVLTSGYANQAQDNFYPAPYLPLIYEVDQANNGTIVAAIRKAAVGIRNRGGRPTAFYCSFDVADRLFGEMQEFVRYPVTGAASASGLVAGGSVGQIATPGGLIDVVPVPSDSIGKYRTASIQTPTINSVTLPPTGLSSTWCEDGYLASEGDLALPYLGSPDPIPLELQMGYGDFNGQNCFVRSFIIYMFIGFAMPVPVHQAKIRIPTTPPGS